MTCARDRLAVIATAISAAGDGDHVLMWMIRTGVIIEKGLRVLRITRSWVGDAGVIIVDVRVNSEAGESLEWHVRAIFPYATS